MTGKILPAETRHRTGRMIAVIPLAVLVTPAAAIDLALPGASAPAAEVIRPADDVTLPVGPWKDGEMPVARGEGKVTQRAWHLRGTQLTTLQTLRAAEEQLARQGFESVYSCADAECGGYDFRYALPLLPEPEMHVDLGDFRHLTAEGPGGALLGLTVSRGAETGYVHLIEVAPNSAPPAPSPLTEPSETPIEDSPPDPVDDIPSALALDGRAVLEGLRFESGSTDLAPEEYASLEELAEWLAAEPGARIALVGHSDASGGLEINRRLSRARAEAVRRRLIDRYGADPERVLAEGAAWLAPRATNATEEGRARNRRVEVVRIDTP